MISSIGAESAYRGYRQQALYTLARILNSKGLQRLTFQPEGLEDLAIFGETGELLEVIQVKAHSNNLTISDFSPKNPNSLFHRALEITRKYPQVVIKIVSFGPIGSEMAEAWKADGNERCSVTQKLIDSGFSADQVDVLFRSVQLAKADETHLRNKVFAFLRESLLGGDPKNAFDLLNYWLYIVAESREKVTYDSLRKKITDVGRYLIERVTYHQEWFTSIIPIKDSSIPENERDNLFEEFYQGVAAQYEHILAKADVIRDDKLREIQDAFRETQVVIIHGASGQGKSTLAYRYLHDFVPDLWRFEVRAIEDRQHALRVARALAGHANAVNAPMVIYIDVRPSDRNWPDLVRELAQHRELHLLITVREEDWRRASISKIDFDFKTIDLIFDETEARQLYSQLATLRTPDRFLSFEDAWKRFGDGGPLMEFVYLITQNEILRERLRQQIRRLQDSVRTGQLQPNELQLLRLVSVASAHEARIDLGLLVKHLQLPEPQRTLELFEREYLLRRSADGRFIEGLHPIRSAILVDPLTDLILNPWSAIASMCLPMIIEEDIEVFLLYSFSQRRDDKDRLLEALSLYQPNTWTGLAGVLRVLLWLGVQEYITNNQNLINELFEYIGSSWYFIIDCDLANISKGFSTSWWNNASFISEQMKKFIEDAQKRQTPKGEVFVYATNWLVKCSKQPISPNNLSDWAGLAEANFWIGYLHINSPIPSWITKSELDEAINKLPIVFLSEIVLGLSFAWGDQFYNWLNENRNRILDRFRQETQTVMVEDDGETIRAHFIVDSNNAEKNISEGQTHTSYLHNEALYRVEILRKLLPDRKKYGCKGYGHRLGALTLPFDDTEKEGIPVEVLPPPWAKKINSIFILLSEYSLRPETWQEYAKELYQLRERIIDSLRKLQHALVIHFRKQKSVSLLEKIDLDQWKRLSLMLSRPPLLPKSAVDQWGFIGEGLADIGNSEDNREVKTQLHQQAEKAIALWKYQSFLTALKDFTFFLSNFYSQSPHVLILNSFIGKVKSARQRDVLLQAAVKEKIRTDFGHLSTYNFAEAFKALSHLQREFRKYFSQFFDAKALEQLEKNEQDVFKQAWGLWYQFAFHSSQVLQDANKVALTKLNDALAQIRKEIRRRFHKLGETQENIKAAILSEDLPWEGKPALWVALDVFNPTDLYAAFESLVNSLRTALNTGGDAKLKRYAIDFWWPITVIVPLLKGRGLDQTVWRLLTSMILSGEALSEDKWWNYVRYPVQSEDWNKLGLSRWEHSQLELINRFQSTAATLSLLAAHISDFNRLPEVDEHGKEILRNHLKIQGDHINDVFHQVLGQINEMLTLFNNLTTEELKQRLGLMAARQGLIEIRKNIMPTEDYDGELKLNLDGMREWMEKLQVARGQAEFIRLDWASMF